MMTNVQLPMRTGVLLLLVCAGLAPALAEEETPARTIGLPGEGITLPLPAGWKMQQYSDAILELEREGARIWIRNYETSRGRAAGRTWTAIEGGGMRAQGVVPRPNRPMLEMPWLEIEVVLPAGKEGMQGEIDQFLDALDTTPYQNPNRHVDWKDGWTLDLPPGFARRASKDGIVRFEAAQGKLRIEVDRNPTGVAWSTPEAALMEVYTRFEKDEGVTTKDTPTVELPTGASGSERHRAHLGLNPDADGDPAAWLHVLLTGPWRVALFARTIEGEAYTAAKAALGSFRAETDPGPRVGDAAGKRLRFEKGGPPVTFTLPKGWALKPSSSQMRLAEWTLGDEGSTVGVVYYFGAGGGGPVKGNFDRWKGQMGDDVEATTEIVEIATDVKAHVLDAKGAYSPGMVSGNPHGQAHGQFRMLAAILEVPEGPLFLKLVGPDDLIERHAANFRRFLDSFRVASSD